MSHADAVRDYERATDVLDTLAGLFDTTRDQLPAGVGVYYRPDGLGVFLPLPVAERVLRELDAAGPEAVGVEPWQMVGRDALDHGARWQGRGAAARQTLTVLGYLGEDPHNPQALDRVTVQRTGGVSDSALNTSVTMALDQLVAAFEPVEVEEGADR